MTNRKILIVDDDSELREALVEQLALHEEFEPIAVDNGTKGVQTAKAAGHNTDSDTILGLETGANDYVTKPFRFAVLLARIRAQLRQHEASEDAVFIISHADFTDGAVLGDLNPCFAVSGEAQALFDCARRTRSSISSTARLACASFCASWARSTTFVLGPCCASKNG